MALFRGFSEKEFARSGIASNNHITVRAIAYIVAGHAAKLVTGTRSKMTGHMGDLYQTVANRVMAGLRTRFEARHANQY